MSVYAVQSAAGLPLLILISWLVSEDRGAFRRGPHLWKAVAASLAMQLALALVLLRVPLAQSLLLSLNGVVEALTKATGAGTEFVFGYLGGGQAPFPVEEGSNMLILAFNILPLLLVMAALSALLWHWRVLAWVTRFFAFALQRTLDLGGAVGVNTAASLFMGMVESPLLIRPYLARLHRSELFMVMTVGLATVAGTVLVLYATILNPVIPNAIGQILTASLISLPAAILIAQVIVPPGDNEEPTSVEGWEGLVSYQGSLDAITRGTLDGLGMYLNIIAMLVVMVALVALANILFGLAPDVGGEPMTLQRLFGWLFAPVVFLMGVPWHEATTAGQLMGTKTILNEFIAYLDLVQMPADALSERTRLIMVYALCGFANLGSVGIMIGGLAALVPERREEIVDLSIKALIGGTLSTMMTGAIVGIVGIVG